jgi:transcriptional regulator with XRE-family HTH domain
METVVYIGDKLKLVRLRRAMTQRQLAEAAGLSHRTIVGLETNRTEPHPSTLGKLAEALNVDPRELLED